MKTITRVFTFDDGSVVKATASFECSALSSAPIRYEGPVDRLSALIGARLPDAGMPEWFEMFFDQYDGRGVHITTETSGQWVEIEL